MISGPLDLVLANAALRGVEGLRDIGIRDGRIAAIEPRLQAPCQIEDVGGRLVIAGFVDSHVHLDKSCLMSCCGTGDLAHAIRTVSALKRDFTEDDVYGRGARTLEKAILHGTTQMRTHVEIDPRIGLRGFRAIQRLKRDYAFAIDLQICVFPQEGLSNDPGAEQLLIEALDAGADLLGGCPYTDIAPEWQIARLFDIACERDLDLDLHLDFDLDVSSSQFDTVCRQTELRRRGGRVVIGHATKFSSMAPADVEAAARRLAAVGVAVTALPATDLYLNGRDRLADVPRGVTRVHQMAALGVTASVATNNVLNPFTPFGDGSLLRMANLYANVAQVSPDGFEACFDLVTDSAARLMRLEAYGVALGHVADLVVLDAPDAVMALAEIAQAVMGFKRGVQSFARPLPLLMRPGAASDEDRDYCPEPRLVRKGS